MNDQSGQLTILYIEDNFTNRILIRRVLEAEGYRVLDAETAPEGIALAEANEPDLILMDISLPEMNGLEATVRLRAIEHLRHTPIVALTANVMKGDREQALEAGCAGYIQKPIDVDRLPDQIRSFLQD